MGHANKQERGMLRFKEDFFDYQKTYRNIEKNKNNKCFSFLNGSGIVPEWSLDASEMVSKRSKCFLNAS